ncbi:MAG: hypothetical protein COB07_09860 [Sulfurovum sp.]|nr:MAG: hypothetical protein COB07_09860 [Sulfurovum sp.]
MKTSKTLLPLLLILAFNTALHAEKYKFEVCIQAEHSFWKTMDNVNSNTDKSLYEVLDKKDKRNYLMIVSGKIEQRMSDVKSRCKNMSPDVLAAYNKKIRALQKQVNTLN